MINLCYTSLRNHLRAKSNMKIDKILALASLYFSICGISAILWPESWYYTAGLIIENDNSTTLVLAVCGGMMVGLAVGGFSSIYFKRDTFSITIALLAANIADLLIVFYMTYNQYLPKVNGVIFGVVDAIWCLLLTLYLKSIGKIFSSHQ